MNADKNFSRRPQALRRSVLSLLLIGGAASLAVPCAAQCDYTVTTLADSGTGSLRAAIPSLAASGGSYICFSVTGTITLASTLNITLPVTITDPGGTGITISGNNQVQILSFNLPAATDSARLNGLTLTAGNGLYGGAIENVNGNLTLVATTITGNTASEGGGIYNQGGTLTVSQCAITNNTAPSSGDSGGGNGGGILNSSGLTLNLQNSLVSGNSSGSSGGGVYNEGNLVITGGTFVNNSSAYGGAIDVEYYGTITDTQGTLFNGNSVTQDGGAIWNDATQGTISQALFTGNSTSGVSGESTPCGGAICNDGSLTISESTFTGNSAPGGSGGAIENQFASLNLYNVTIYGNSAGVLGSGVYSDNGESSPPNIDNSIISGNTATGSSDATDCDGCSAANDNADLIGVTVDLGPLAWNGGPTQTMMPLPGGPAIGAGNTQYVIDDTDQRGFSRLNAANGVDIGAVQTHYSSVSFVAQPSNTLTNTTITPAVSVQVVEQDGSLTNYPTGVSVTVSLQTTQGQGVSGALTGTLTEYPASNGKATLALFSDLAVNTAGTYELFATTAIPGNSSSADPTYSATSNSFVISVPQVVTLAWKPAPLVYGPMPQSELNASATINGSPSTGTFVYTFTGTSNTINVGQIYPVGTYEVTVTYTPTDSTSQYSLSTTLQITQAAPALTWATPAAIYTSTPLSATQLDATASGVTGAALAGTFVYNPAAGATLSAGSHTLSTTFTPTDTADYTTATAQVTIQVNAVTASSVALQESAQAITFGQSATFTATVTGSDGKPFSGGTATFSSNGAAIGSATVANGLAAITTSALTGGTDQIAVSYTNATLAQPLTSSISITVNKAAPTLTWATPAAIYTSTPLTATQLDASAAGVTGAALAGTFVYTPAAGATLPAGSQTLSTTFAPTDTTDYATATKQVTIQVNTATAVSVALQESAQSITFGQSVTFTAAVTGTDGKPFSGGTAVFTSDGTAIGSATVVNGSAAISVTTLTAGTHVIAVSYTSTPSSEPLTSSVNLAVNKATPVLSWATPSSITTLTPLSATQLDATAAGVTRAALPGTFAYTPAAGTLLTAGTHVLSTTFTPTDAVDYTNATAQVTIQVSSSPITITAISPSSTTLSSNPLPIVVTGTGFTSTSVIQVNGSALATAVTSETSLSATIPASDLTTAGTLNLTVFDPSSKLTSNGFALTVSAPAASATITIEPATTSGAQSTITISLSSAYPSDLVGTLNLTFAPSGANGVDDPTVQFSTGGRTLTFTVPAGSTKTPQVGLQTGTVAGTITVTLTFTAGGVNVTPNGLAPVTLVISAAAPTITSVTFANNSTGLITVTINGFSNTRDMTQANFIFTGTGAGSLGSSSTVDVPATSLFSPWYSSAASDQYGSEFTYTQNFQLSRPDANITGVTVTLTNSVGISASVNSQ